MESNATNEPEPDTDTWTPISAVTNRLLHKIGVTPRLVAAATAKPSEIDEQQNEEREHQSDTGRAQQQEGSTKREYVDHRLREIAAFERQAAGLSPGRQKRGARRNP